MKHHWQTIPLVIILLSNVTYYPEAGAQLVTSSKTSIQFKSPPPPPDRSAAGERGEAASRGCGNNKQSLMALVPDYKQTIKLDGGETIPITKVWGLTTAEYPTFWFFVPYDKSSITKMEFVIKDESQKPSKTIYRAFLNKPERPGIIGIPIDKTAKPLQVSQTKHQKMYRWFFKVRVKCNPEQSAELRTVEGWIERVKLNPTLADSLKQVKPLQQAALYAENGIWHNALTTLAKLRLANPKDASLLANWTSLLKSEELDSLANHSLINCCQPTN
ncbi:MAG: DUF928 domain-containing protein [Calothrix sp. MO_167.B12]|nr:DUF928 domain-containing protein [Calothrix sp. MO_167.B12]